MKLLFLIALIVISSLCYADIIVSDNSINESYSPNIKVSGNFLVGIQTSANIRSIEKSLHVMLPKNSVGWLCIELNSIDGRYKASLAHYIKQPISGISKIVFNTKFQEELNNYNANEIAIKASFKASCVENATKKLLISGWNSLNGDELLLLIRSDARKDMVYIPNSLNPVSYVKCKRIRSTNTISYDKKCSIRSFNIEKINQIEIVRKNLQPIKPEYITIN